MNTKISFYTNGKAYRIVINGSINGIVMIETIDDRKVEKVWRKGDSDVETNLNLTTMKYVNKEWRLMEEDGVDAGLIRDVISALHFDRESSEFNDNDQEAVTFIIEKTRSIWARNEDEPIPDPIPHPSFETDKK